MFLGPGLDSHAAALKYTNAEVRYLVHTDQPKLVGDAIKRKTGRHVECRPAPAKFTYQAFGNCHAEAEIAANRGEIVSLLTADEIISREFFIASERRFAEGKRMIVTAATRTLPKTPVPTGVSSLELLSWSIDNQHPVISECYWKTGKTRLPYAIYFKDGDAVVMRGFHLQPVALLKDRELKHTKTIDWDLAECYSRNEIHVVTSADELAVAEISPPEKKLPVGPTPFDLEIILNWAKTKTTDLHWWFLGHRIMLRGEGQFEDEALVKDLVELRT